MRCISSAYLIIAVLAAGCGGVSEAADGNRLTLVAYSTPREVYAELT